MGRSERAVSYPTIDGRGTGALTFAVLPVTVLRPGRVVITSLCPRKIWQFLQPALEQ